MNIVNNYNLTQKFPDVEFYFEPLCDDGGLLNWCRHVYVQNTNKRFTISDKTTSYHGFEHDVSAYKGVTADTKHVVDLLCQNKSVAVFYGQCRGG